MYVLHARPYSHMGPGAGILDPQKKVNYNLACNVFYVAVTAFCPSILHFSIIAASLDVFRDM